MKLREEKFRQTDKFLSKVYLSKNDQNKLVNVLKSKNLQKFAKI